MGQVDSMSFEYIPRGKYEYLLQDGVRVDRVRALVKKLKKIVKENTMPLARVVYLVEEALMDTDLEKMKLIQKQEEIRKVEAEYIKT
jgi:hypothetical protein